MEKQRVSSSALNIEPVINEVLRELDKLEYAVLYLYNLDRQTMRQANEVFEYRGQGNVVQRIRGNFIWPVLVAYERDTYIEEVGRLPAVRVQGAEPGEIRGEAR